MKFSVETDKIIPAMAKAQFLCKKPKKNKEAHHYKYADLDEVMDSITAAIREANLMYIQGTGFEGDRYGLFTTVMHIESSQYVSTFSILDAELDPQDQGKENTYFRRYSLQNIFNLVAEDDTDAADVKRKTKVTSVTQFKSNGVPSL